jgi:hypothetical protein
MEIELNRVIAVHSDVGETDAHAPRSPTYGVPRAVPKLLSCGAELPYQAKGSAAEICASRL